MSFLKTFFDPGDLSGERAGEAADKAAELQMSAAEMISEALLTAAREGISYMEAAEARAREDVAPWREAGVTALGEIGEMLEAGPGEFTESPGYGFRLSEGVKALDQSASSRGGVLSGANQKAITRYGQDYATNDYDNFLRRYYEKMNPHFNLAGLGGTSAGQTASNAMTTGQSGANLIYQGAYDSAQPRLDAMNTQASNVMNLYNQGQDNFWGVAGLAGSLIGSKLSAPKAPKAS